MKNVKESEMQNILHEVFPMEKTSFDLDRQVDSGTLFHQRVIWSSDQNITGSLIIRAKKYCGVYYVSINVSTYCDEIIYKKDLEEFDSEKIKNIHFVDIIRKLEDHGYKNPNFI